MPTEDACRGCGIWHAMQERRGGGGHLAASEVLAQGLAGRDTRPELARDYFIDNLLVRIDLIIEMILVDRPCAMGV